MSGRDRGETENVSLRVLEVASWTESEQAVEKVLYFVIPNEMRNLSLV